MFFTSLQFRSGNIQNYRKMGKLRVNFGGNIGFWGKNGVWWVNLLSLGKIGKKKRSKTFENVRKRSKIFKNIQILSRNVQKYSKIFDIFRR